VPVAVAEAEAGVEDEDEHGGHGDEGEGEEAGEGEEEAGEGEEEAGEGEEEADDFSAKEAVVMALRQKLFEKVTMARALQQRLERTLLCEDGRGSRPTSPDSALALLRERQYSTAGIAFGAYEGFEPDR